MKSSEIESREQPSPIEILISFRLCILIKIKFFLACFNHLCLNWNSYWDLVKLNSKCCEQSVWQKWDRHEPQITKIMKLCSLLTERFWFPRKWVFKKILELNFPSSDSLLSVLWSELLKPFASLQAVLGYLVELFHFYKKNNYLKNNYLKFIRNTFIVLWARSQFFSSASS